MESGRYRGGGGVGGYREGLDEKATRGPVCSFLTGGYLIYNVVFISVVQQSDSVIHIHMFILF